jgi:microcystin-dependent protein
MERFVKPVSNGGVPYLNTDIFYILQQNNLISYKSILDEMNDAIDNNSGIILTGCKFNSIPSTGVVDFDFRNSLIYLGGDFLEPIPSLATQSNYIIQSNKFYLKSYSEVEKRLFKVTDDLTSIVETKYFEVAVNRPTGPYIEIEINPTTSVNLSSRYLNRVHRHYISQPGQIFMTYDTTNFSGSGLGIGDLSGFALCDGRNGTVNLVGQFLIGFDKNSNTTPVDLSSVTLTGLSSNYGKLKNKGGFNNVTLEEVNLPPHNHATQSGQSTSVYHNHEITTGSLNFNLVPDSQKKVVGKAKKFITTPQNNTAYYKQISTGFLFIGNTLYEPLRDNTTQTNWNLVTGKLTPTTTPTRAQVGVNLEQHTHTVPVESDSGQPHNNLPPYVSIAYYQKI